jgi:hypothetical protein
LIDGVLLVAIGSLQPVSDTWNGSSDVHAVEFEVRVVVNRFSIIDVWVVDEVPVFLILTTRHSECISKSGTFNKGIALLILGVFLVGGRMEEGVGALECSGVVLSQEIVSHTGNYAMLNLNRNLPIKWLSAFQAEVKPRRLATANEIATILFFICDSTRK